MTTRRAGNDGQRGFTLIELLVVSGIIGLIGAIAIPALLRAKITANETAIIGSMRAVNSAQAAYASSASNGGYATDFTILTRSCPGGNQGFLSPDLAGDPAQKTGYFDFARARRHRRRADRLQRRGDGPQLLSVRRADYGPADRPPGLRVHQPRRHLLRSERRRSDRSPDAAGWQRNPDSIAKLHGPLGPFRGRFHEYSGPLHAVAQPILQQTRRW